MLVTPCKYADKRISSCGTFDIEEHRIDCEWSVAHEHVLYPQAKGMRILKKEPFEDDWGKGNHKCSIYLYLTFITKVVRTIVATLFLDKFVDLKEAWIFFP